MKITEPMTMITDYLLGGYILYLAIRIFYQTSTQSQFSSWLFGVAFLFSAIGAIVGGTSHGFKNYLSESWDYLIWKSTVYSIGFGSMFMLFGGIISSVSNSTLAWVLVAVTFVKFGVYSWWMLHHDDFIYVIADYGPSMLVIIILKVYTLFSFSDPSSWWIISGIMVSFIAAGIQASGKGLHKHFNHNDIFHIVQIPAMYLLYRGSLLLVDLV